MPNQHNVTQSKMYKELEFGEERVVLTHCSYIACYCRVYKFTWPSEFIASKFTYASKIKNLPAVQETWVWSLDWADPLEKGKATHSSILA